jgi:hypothetical protein
MLKKNATDRFLLKHLTKNNPYKNVDRHSGSSRDGFPSSRRCRLFRRTHGRAGYARTPRLFHAAQARVELREPLYFRQVVSTEANDDLRVGKRSRPFGTRFAPCQGGATNGYVRHAQMLAVRNA